MKAALIASIGAAAIGVLVVAAQSAPQLPAAEIVITNSAPLAAAAVEGLVKQGGLAMFAALALIVVYLIHKERVSDLKGWQEIQAAEAEDRQQRREKDFEAIATLHAETVSVLKEVTRAMTILSERVGRGGQP